MLGLAVDPVTASCDRAAERWTRLCKVAIGDDPTLARVRDLIVTVRQTLAAEGDAGADDAAAARVELWDLRRALDAECPLSDDDVMARSGAMGELLRDMHDTEVRAIGALASARERTDRPAAVAGDDRGASSPPCASRPTLARMPSPSGPPR